MRTACDAAALRCFLQNVRVDEQVDVRNVLGEHIQPAYLPLRASDRSSANLGTPDDHRFNLLYFRAVPPRQISRVLLGIELHLFGHRRADVDA